MAREGRSLLHRTCPWWGRWLWHHGTQPSPLHHRRPTERIHRLQHYFWHLSALGGSSFTSHSRENGANVDFYKLAAVSGQDITPKFYRNPKTEYPSCTGLSFAAASWQDCCDPADTTCTTNPCDLGAIGDATFKEYNLVQTSFDVGYDWDHVAILTDYLVIDGAVLNLAPYLDQQTPLPNDALRHRNPRLNLTSTTRVGERMQRVFSTAAQISRAPSRASRSATTPGTLIKYRLAASSRSSSCTSA